MNQKTQSVNHANYNQYPGGARIDFDNIKEYKTTRLKLIKAAYENALKNNTVVKKRIKD